MFNSNNCKKYLFEKHKPNNTCQFKAINSIFSCSFNADHLIKLMIHSQIAVLVRVKENKQAILLVNGIS